ncbi:MAG: ACP S-malonyltransferase [Chloroflexi bacterium]|nr:ACP S-malonyltransferase [Chloroflexota bacterium]
MSDIVLLFPGQGSQEVGMGADLAAHSQAARRIFEQADDILGFSLSRLCFEGPEAELTDTINAQPALLTTGIAALAALEEALGRPLAAGAAAGHSLGEYSALVAAGALDFPHALRLVRERGRLMKFADERAPGGMAAIIALDTDVIARICADASARTNAFVHIANDNCPGQVVISGDEAALTEAMAAAEKAGARKVVRLAITIAAHSPLMGVVQEEFAAAVRATPIHPPRFPVIANSTAQPLLSAEAIREELVGQLQNTVRWTESMQYLIDQGFEQFVEFGPGRVLAGLMKRIDRRFRRMPSIATWEDVKKLLSHQTPSNLSSNSFTQN